MPYLNNMKIRSEIHTFLNPRSVLASHWLVCQDVQIQTGSLVTDALHTCVACTQDFTGLPVMDWKAVCNQPDDCE